MDTWRSISLDMVEYKSIFKMRNTEELYAALEDHAVSLSAMKASRFFPVFEATIMEWEKKLSQVSEVIELILQVWMLNPALCSMSPTSVMLEYF